jgi:hypothetical protein
VGIIGQNGAGKSTLLNMLTGIDRPTAGEIIVRGTDITKLSRAALADWRAANIGYIFQTHNLIPVLTAYENVELPLLLLPMSAAERRKRLIALVKSSPEATATPVGDSHLSLEVCGKRFGWFLDDHHGDGRLALNLKAPPGANQTLAAKASERFHVPVCRAPRLIGVCLILPP